ncbi:MAG: MauE/DoxX family redox-associated membrane protein, partial [Candidatus Neomarinimicrobiota bacterium]
MLAARLLLGALFVVSGVSKVLDAGSFVAVLPLYQLPAWLLPLGALLPTLEAALGVSLILGIAPRLTALAALGALALFSAMLIVGMIGGDLVTCGCFGRLLEA